MKTIFLIALFVSSCFASAPKYNFDDPKLNAEFQNAYKDIAKVPQFIDIYPLTRAQIMANTPKRVGRIYFCTDCTTSTVCISTGATIGSFSDISARTGTCQ